MKNKIDYNPPLLIGKPYQNPSKELSSESHKEIETEPTVKPVFDCLFCADSYVMAQKLSILPLTQKYAYNHILLRINELALRSRKHLGQPFQGSLKPKSDLVKIIKELSTQTKSLIKPCLLQDIMKKKFKLPSK